MARRAVVTAAVGLALLVALASPAAAHAVLLRTEPAPQTTVAQPPPAVRLHFSEAVEVTFGAVRVFDVDGHRVDRGNIRRLDADREVAVAVPHLRDGTYSVTWRVVSADGHPVHGGFSFYVGAPSTISAVAPLADHGAGRLVGWGFGVDRFLLYAALLALLGATVVRRFVWTPAVRAAGLAGAAWDHHFRRRVARTLVLAWIVGLLAAAVALVFEAASASGLSLWSSARPHVVRQVLDTGFGRWWSLLLVLLAIAVVPVIGLTRRARARRMPVEAWIVLLGLLVAGAAVAIAASGHARTLGHPVLDVVALGAHLAAVAIWVGGLGVVAVLGPPAWRAASGEERVRTLRELVPRFSRLAIGAVAVVILTGVIGSLATFRAPSDLWRITYGRVVLAKIVLLTVALVLAGRHLLVVPRRLRDDDAAPSTVATFTRTATVELVLLVLTVALAAGLVVLVPGRSLALAASGPVNADRRAGPYTVQLFIDPTTVGANQLHLTFVGSTGLAAAEVQQTSVSVGPAAGAGQAVAMRLISPGHFVGDVSLPAPGRYRVSVSSGSATTTFTFRLRARS